MKQLFILPLLIFGFCCDGATFQNQFTTNLAGTALPQAIVVSNNVTVDAAHGFIGTFTGNGAGVTNLNLASRVLTVGSNANYSTITAAKAAAIAGNLILVYPGNYSENNLLKPGVNYCFLPGSSISYTCSVSTIADGYGIFDDRTTGATTNRITGWGDFYYSTGTNLNVTTGCYGNTNSVGPFVLTNGNSDSVFEFHKMDGDAFPTCNAAPVNTLQTPVASLFYISQCRRCELRGNEMVSSLRYETPNGNASVFGGLYWEQGETYLNVAHIGPFVGSYGIWPNDPPGGIHTENLWVTSQLCEGYIYASTSNATYRSWYDIKELRVTNSIANSAFQMLGGSHYLTAQKISCLDPGSTAIVVGSGGGGSPGEVWVKAEKITAQNSPVGWLQVAGGSTIHASVQHYQAIAALSGAGFSTANAGDLMEVDGGEAALSGIGVLHGGGRAIFKNVGICTTNANLAANFPVKVTSAGLSLQGCRLVSPALCLTNIFATSAQTVGSYWTASNKTNNIGITLSPNAGYTFDANVR